MEEIRLTSWYGKYPIIHRVLYIQPVVVWDFWTINSIILLENPLNSPNLQIYNFTAKIAETKLSIL